MADRMDEKLKKIAWAAFVEASRGIADEPLLTDNSVYAACEAVLASREEPLRKAAQELDALPTAWMRYRLAGRNGEHPFEFCEERDADSFPVYRKTEIPAALASPLHQKAEHFPNYKTAYEQNDELRFENAELQRSVERPAEFSTARQEKALTTYLPWITMHQMGALKSYRCSKGHVLRGKNLYIRSNGRRECRKCSLARNKAWIKKHPRKASK